MVRTGGVMAEHDYVQRPVDEGYRRGIESMGTRGAHVGTGEWFQALAKMLSFPLAMGMRLSPGSAGVKLYRGEGRDPFKSPPPEWLSQLLPEATKKAQGRWFAQDPKIAQWYAKDAGPSGQMKFVIIPPAVRNASQVSSFPGSHPAQYYSLDPKHEFFLPPEWAKRAQRLWP